MDYMSNTDFLKAVEEVKAKLDKQGAQSSSDGTCWYRHEGMACAAGHLIKDEFYHGDLELSNVTHYEVLEAIQDSLGYKLTKIQIKALRELQDMHDIQWEPEKQTYSQLIADHLHPGTESLFNLQILTEVTEP